MRIRSPIDFWAGIVFVSVAAAFIFFSRQYNHGTMHRMGPGLFPTLVGALLAGLGIAIAIRSLVVDGPTLPRFYARPLFVSAAAIVSFGLLLRSFGLVVAIAAVVVVGTFAGRERHLIETAGLAGALIAFSVVVFVWLLGLPLPLWPAAQD